MWNVDTHGERSHLPEGVRSKVDSEGEFVARSCIEDVSYSDYEDSESEEESYLSDTSDSDDEESETSDQSSS